MPANGRFRFSAKRAFLTYAQCGELTKERVLEFLRDSRGAAWYSVGLEQHEDGGNHIHAYAEWLARVDTTDCTHFDVDGRHPNVQPVRSRTAVLEYVKKGGDYIGNCAALSSTTTRYGDIIRDAGGRTDFLERVVQHDPRGACYGLPQLQQFALWRWPDEKPQYVPSYTSFVEPEQLTAWRAENLDVEV